MRSFKCLETAQLRTGLLLGRNQYFCGRYVRVTIPKDCHKLSAFDDRSFQTNKKPYK